MSEIARLLQLMSERHPYFQVQISRYNAIGGDMIHVWAQHGDCTKSNSRMFPTAGATELSADVAAKKVIRKFFPNEK